MWRCIIIHQDEVIADNVCVEFDVEVPRLGTTEPSWIPAAGQGDSVCPATLIPLLTISDPPLYNGHVGRCWHLVPLYWPAPHSSTTISATSTGVQTAKELGSARPVVIFDVRECVSGTKIDVMESVPDSLDADIGYSGVQKVLMKGLSRAEPISIGLKSKKLVSSGCCCSLSATFMSSDGYTKRATPGPSPRDHTATHQGRLS
jgi:hypothetical protein